jgi:hypothetical protein
MASQLGILAMSEVNPQEFGQLIGTVQSLQRSVDSLQNRVEQLNSTMEHVKGGWGAIVAIAGVVGGIIEVAHWFIGNFKGH